MSEKSKWIAYIKNSPLPFYLHCWMLLINGSQQQMNDTRTVTRPLNSIHTLTCFQNLPFSLTKVGDAKTKQKHQKPCLDRLIWQVKGEIRTTPSVENTITFPTGCILLGALRFSFNILQFLHAAPLLPSAFTVVFYLLPLSKSMW